MAQAGSSGQDGGLVDRHGILGVVRYDGMAGLGVRVDLLVLLVDLHAPPLRPWEGVREGWEDGGMELCRGRGMEGKRDEGREGGRDGGTEG